MIIPSSLWRYASILTSVIAMCQQLLPISHLILLQSKRASALSPVRADWIGQHVQRRARTISIALGQHGIVEHLPVPLIQVLTTNLNLTTHPPNAVVSVTSDWWKVHHNAADSYNGCPGTIRQAGRSVTGVIQRRGQSGQFMLWVPTKVLDQGVQWETVPSVNPAILHVWPFTRILMLPLTNARHRPERLT